MKKNVLYAIVYTSTGGEGYFCTAICLNSGVSHIENKFADVLDEPDFKGVLSGVKNADDVEGLLTEYCQNSSRFHVEFLHFDADAVSDAEKVGYLTLQGTDSNSYPYEGQEAFERVLDEVF